MSILKSGKDRTVVHYEFTLDQMKALIASDLGVSTDKVSLQYVEGDIGYGDPMDRFPSPRGVVGIRVTVTE